MKKTILGLLLSFILIGCSTPTETIEIDPTVKPLTIEEAKSNDKRIVEIFSDMQCSHCKALDPTIQKLEENLPEVEFRFYHFPFLAPSSTTAAIAVECVRREDETKANKYITSVFNSENLSSASLRLMAKETGIDEEKFNNCLKKKETGPLISAFKDEAKARNVESTPSIFIDGVLYSENRNYEVLYALLSQAK